MTTDPNNPNIPSFDSQSEEKKNDEISFDSSLDSPIDEGPVIDDREDSEQKDRPNTRLARRSRRRIANLFKRLQKYLLAVWKQFLWKRKLQKCPYCLTQIETITYREVDKMEGKGIPICPTCQKDLPADFYDQKSPIVAIVGGANSGKSTFITALLQQLLIGDKFLSTQKVSASIFNPEGKEKFDSYYEQLFIRHMPLPGTLPNEAGSNEPVIVRVKRRKGRKLKSIFITMFDTPGEEFYRKEDLLAKHPNIHNADAILFLADPLNMTSLYEELYAYFPKKVKNYSNLNKLKLIHRSEYAIFENLREIFMYSGKVNLKGRIDPPLAICISKFDLLEDLTSISFRTTEDFSFNSSSIKEFLLEVKDTSHDLSEWLQEVEPKFVQIIFDLCKDYHFFPVSPLGNNMGGQHGVEPEPNGVIHPFIWLLSRLKFF